MITFTGTTCAAFVENGVYAIITFTGITASATYANLTIFNTYTGVTAPATYQTISNFNTFSGMVYLLNRLNAVMFGLITNRLFLANLCIIFAATVFLFFNALLFRACVFLNNLFSSLITGLGFAARVASNEALNVSTYWLYISAITL